MVVFVPKDDDKNTQTGLKGTNTQHSSHMGKKIQTNLMAEIYSKSYW